MSAIDEKKDNAQKTKNNVPLFLKTVMHSLKNILMFVILSSIVLYATKLAAQNIIPEDLDAFPFKPGSEPPPADKLPQTKEEDIFGKTYKIKFLPEIHNVFIDFLRGKPHPAAAQAATAPAQAQAPPPAKENVVSAFLRKQFLCSLYYNFVLLTMFFKLLSGWNEHAIVLLGPFLFVFFMGFLCVFGGIGFIYYYFINLSILMKGESTLLKIILPVIFVCLLCCVVLFLPFIQTPLLVYCVATIICYSSELTPINNSSDTTEKSNVLKFGTVFALHYQNLIMAAVCVYVTKAAYANLGTSEGIASIIVAVLMAMGTFGIGLFKKPLALEKKDSIQKGGGRKRTPKELKTTIQYLYKFLKK